MTSLATNSYSFLARDEVLKRIQAIPFFSGFTFAKTREFQVQPQSIPYCGVYFVSETLSPDGDADTGEVRHRTVLRLGISVIVENNDPEQAEETLDEAYRVILGHIFTDETLYNGDIVKFQSFPNADRTHVFGDIGATTELPIAELQLHLNCDLGTITWPPDIEDQLKVVHVETAFPVGGDTESVQQVKVEYDILQSESFNIGKVLRGSSNMIVDATVSH